MTHTVKLKTNTLACINHKYVCIPGDFNARMSNEPDFIYEEEDEEFVLEILEYNYTLNVWVFFFLETQYFKRKN